MISLIIFGALSIASPVFARHHHHDDGDSQKASHDSAANRPSTHAAPAKPAAKTPAAPVAAAPVKAAPAPAASPVSPLDMTRDGNAKSASDAGSGARAADAGRLNPISQILRMAGALVVVLALILGVAHLFRRSPLMTRMAGTPGVSGDVSFGGTLKAAFSFLSPLAALQPLKRAGSQLRAMRQTSTSAAVPDTPLPLLPLDSGLLRLSGAQALPGSASSVYLIQIGSKGLLLGASASGPIQVLGEFEGMEASAVPALAMQMSDTPAAGEEQDASPHDRSEASSYLVPDFEAMLREQDEEAAFEALLREESPSDPERGETLVVQSILERLNQTRDRLSRRLNGGTVSGEDRHSA
jgi:flagellar biogenesis protein FliO